MAKASAVLKYFFFHVLLVIVEDLLIIFNVARFFYCGEENWATFTLILPFVPGVLAAAGFIGRAFKFPETRKKSLQDAAIYLFFPFFHLIRY